MKTLGFRLFILFKILVPVFAKYNIGGRDALQDEFPYVVSVQFKLKNAFVSRCGGGILTTNYILSACHCTESVNNSKDCRIVAGTVNIKNLHANAQIRKVKSIIKHKNYTVVIGGWHPYDVSFLELESPLLQTTSVRLMPLVSHDSRYLDQKTVDLVSQNQQCDGMGWGTADRIGVYNSEYSDVMKVVKIDLTNSSHCEKLLCVRHQPLCKVNFTAFGQICGKCEQEHVCAGDPGSPVVCDGNVYGIISWAPACSEVPDEEENSSNIYSFTKIHLSLDWPGFHLNSSLNGTSTSIRKSSSVGISSSIGTSPRIGAPSGIGRTSSIKSTLRRSVIIGVTFIHEKTVISPSSSPLTLVNDVAIVILPLIYIAKTRLI